MRDQTIIEGFKSLEQRLQQVVQFVQNLQQAVRLDSTSKEIRLLSIQQLLIKKGILTEAEITEQTGEVIKQMQKEAEEQAAKAKIVPATPEQVQQVEATKTEVPEEDKVKAPEVVPPPPPDSMLKTDLVQEGVPPQA